MSVRLENAHSPQSLEGERSLLYEIREKIHVPSLEESGVLDKARLMLDQPWLADGSDLSTVAACRMGNVNSPFPNSTVEVLRFTVFYEDAERDSLQKRFKFSHVADKWGNPVRPYDHDDVKVVTSMLVGLRQLKEHGVLPHLQSNLADIYDPNHLGLENRVVAGRLKPIGDTDF